MFKGMTRRSATFHEVPFGLDATVKLLPEPSLSVPEDLDSILSVSGSPARLILANPPRSLFHRVTSFSRMSLKMTSPASSRSRTSSAVTVTELNETTDSSGPPADKESFSNSKKGKFPNLKRVFGPFSKMKTSSKKEKRRPSEPPSEEYFPTEIIPNLVTVQTIVDGWAEALRVAMEMDLRGSSEEALAAYHRFNIKITKEAIYHFELFTCDQQKLLTRVVNGVDRRIGAIKSALSKPEGQPGSSEVESEASISEDTSFNDLRQLWRLLSTVKTIGSKTQMPVVLFYREKCRRTHHRDQKKGKSNKILFPREKREFLQTIGLPGKMVTADGLDFSVEPDPEEIVSVRPRSPTLFSKKDNSSAETSEQQEIPEIQVPETNQEVETSFISEPTDSQLKPQKEERKLSVVGRYLNLRKRLSVSPQEGSSETRVKNGERYQATSTAEDDEELTDLDNRKIDIDARSTLSCDSCSSSGSVKSDFDGDAPTDVAVLPNYTHRDTLLPAPFRDPNGVYIVLALDKIGVKNTIYLCNPFLRMSLRDEKGILLARQQETQEWDVINSHYLRASGPIFLQETFDILPEDTAIFLELRHFQSEKRKVSTVCYTYLEKRDLQTGEFVCETFRPPVQFTRTNLVPYSKKALFLHLEVKLENDAEEDNEPGEEDNEPGEEDNEPGEEDNEPGEEDKEPGEEDNGPGEKDNEPIE